MEDHWDYYKEILKQHFLTENKPLREVREFMHKTYNFRASIAQYENRFKIWEFRKKQTAQKWIDAQRKVEKRKRDGKESNLYIDGVPIPQKKVRKELSRHNFPTIQERYGQAPSPRTPEGFYICTPPASLANSYLLSTLPWFQFQATIELNPSLDLAGTAAKLAVLSTNNTVPSRPHNLSPIKLTAGILGEITPVLTSWVASTTLKGHANTVRNFHSHLRAILPEQLDEDLLTSTEKLPTLIKLDANAPYLSLVMYLISNNMFAAENFSKMIEYLQNQRDMRLLRSLLYVKALSVDAFAEKFLVAAAKDGNIIIIKEILDAGTDPNTRHGYTLKTPLHYVVERGNIEMAQLLLDAGADVNAPAAHEEGTTALQAAAKKGNIEMVQLLLDAGADVNAPAANAWHGRTALQAAAEKGNIEMIQLLLDAGADVNAPAANAWHGRTALQAAAEKGNIEMIQLLLDAGADVNAPAANAWHGRTALQAAAEKGNIEMIQLLLDAGADVKAPAANGWYGRTAFQAAAEKGDIEMVQLLLDAGADVNAPAAHEEGTNALQAAAKNGNIEMVQLLLDAGADVNAPAANAWHGRTALQAAAQNGNIEMVQLLLDAGADANALPAHHAGMTAIQASAIGGYLGIATILLDNGADVNGQASPTLGKTALAGAAEHGRIDMVQLLLNAGVELHGSGNAQYREALQLASKHGHNAIRKLIKAYYERGGSE